MMIGGRSIAAALCSGDVCRQERPASPASGKDALNVHVEEEIDEDGEREEPDGDEGNEIYLASDGLQILE